MIRAIALLWALCIAACAPAWPYSTMASHTIRTAADRDQDIVWVQHVDGKLYRCYQSSEGPSCQAVKRF